MFGIQILVIQWFLFGFVICDWVEIPLSPKKTYLVTPYNPYIYTPSLVFTSTTTELYETMQPLPKPKATKSHPKKSAIKVPEVMQKITSAVTSANSSTKNVVKKHDLLSKFNSNHSKRNPLNLDTNTKSAKFTTTQSTISESPLMPNKNDHSNYEEDDLEEDDDYEDIYDDDEDNFTDINDDESDIDLDPSDISGNHREKPIYDQPDADYYEEDDYEEESPLETPKGNTRPNQNGFTYVNFMPYLQNIQSTLIRNSQTNTVNGKVSFLTDIKNRLLHAIQSRIDSIWKGRKSRKARSARGDMWDSWEKGEHGMEFPSNEGALLTLGFLTFAVFLIKCILKLIHTIKGKHYNKGMTQIIIQNGTAAPAMNTFRFKRETFDDEEIAKFMTNLETYTPH